MYDYIKGTLVKITAKYIVIEANGLGYIITVANPYSFSDQLNQTIQVYLHQVIRDDAHLLFGFHTEDEKEVLRNINGMPVRITKYEYSGNGDNDLFEIKIKNMSYSTSNQKNTYLMINNEKYGHIISPKTGFPSQNKQVGVITENAFFGDIIL